MNVLFRVMERLASSCGLTSLGCLPSPQLVLQNANGF